MNDPRQTSERIPAFHGYAPELERDHGFAPPLCINISRETGSRGRVIAQRTAEFLGWDLVNQEALEHGSQNPGFSTGFGENLSPAAEAWVEERLAEFAQKMPFASTQHELFLRSVFEIAAIGNHVIIGRTTQWLLPGAGTLCVRLMAPERDRVAYVAEVERMSTVDARRLVRDADQAASENSETILFRETLSQPIIYDLILNTAQFGIDGCASIIAAAARERSDHIKSHR